MRNKTNFSIKETVSVLSRTLPMALSMAVCAGMGTFAGAVFACIAALICGTVDEKKQMPAYASFLIITYTFKEFGASTAALAISLCGVLLALSWRLRLSKKLEALLSSPVIGSVMLLSAITVTVLFTTDYFGIGATGNTVREIIASYISLGFHPNWRGVLYGTIVLVVMITFPRKFKKATKIINASFIALIITAALNLWLNPSDMITSIREIGTPSFNEYRNTVLLPFLHSKPAVLYAFLGGISLYFTCLYSILNYEKFNSSDLIIGGISNCIFGFTTCMAVPFITKKNRLINGFAASLLTAVIFLAFHEFIARIPLHSCAVVLIVGAWQSIKWSEVKKIFSSLLNTALFVLIAVVCLLSGYVFTPAIAFIALEIHSRIASKE